LFNQQIDSAKISVFNKPKAKQIRRLNNFWRGYLMTIWFCVKTDLPPDSVAEAVCAFNTFDEETPKGKCVWITEKGEGAEEYWQILSKSERKEEVSCVALVYREGDSVVLGEVADEVLPNFLAPLLAKYGFDFVKWIVTSPKNPS
jgi:hypothetical protein